LRLLILRLLVAACAGSECHCTGCRADGGAGACITRDAADRRAADGTARSAPHPLAAASRRSRQSRCGRGRDGEIDTRALLRPGETFAVVFFLLSSGLTLRRVGNGALRQRVRSERSQRCSKNERRAGLRAMRLSQIE
jgi:hypothetical protein